MKVDRFEDLRAVALGVGGALALFYGYAVTLVLAGQTQLDRPVTWAGLAAGVACLGWALSTGPARRDTPPSIAS